MSDRPDLKQALGRLLGPAAPEIGCDECFERLDQYVELELAGQDPDGELVLQFPPINRFHRDKVSEPGSGYLSPLVEAIFETFGVRPAIRCVLGQNEAPAPVSQAPIQAPAGQDRGEEDHEPVAVSIEAIEGVATWAQSSGVVSNAG